MTIFLHELRRGRLSLLIWSGALALMLAVSVLLFPLMEEMADLMDGMMAQMGEASSVLGTDSVDLRNFTDYFSMECGEILGLGGAFFAALTGIALLAKEERAHTAEFLLTHPVSRRRIALEKLLAAGMMMLMLELVTFAVTTLCALGIGAEPEWGKLALLFAAYLLMQWEILGITFGFSALLHGNGIGIGLGLAFGLYSLSLLANLHEKLDFLRYVTPFGYANGVEIALSGTLEWGALAAGLGIALLAVVLGVVHYQKKDIIG